MKQPTLLNTPYMFQVSSCNHQCNENENFSFLNEFFITMRIISEATELIDEKCIFSHVRHLICMNDVSNQFKVKRL